MNMIDELFEKISQLSVEEKENLLAKMTKQIIESKRQFSAPKIGEVLSPYGQKTYTAIIRKGKLEYVAICLELNVSASGEDLAVVEKNLKSAIELYLQDLKEHPETLYCPISTEEIIEFLRDTEPEYYKPPDQGLFLRALELHEVPSYV